MLILLPPSEGKSAPASGPTIDWAGLSSPELNPRRKELLTELAEVSAHTDALTLLKVGASLDAEVAANTRLHAAPCAPAAQVYTGVLYAAAGLDSLTVKQQDRAHRTVRTVSALWGAVSPTDLIPAYRLSMGVKLPQTGNLATAWRKHLDQVLAPLAENTVIVDCRSSAYLNAWKPAKTLNTDWVTVRVLRELNGKRTVVSHNAKHARGILTAHLLRLDTEPRTAHELLVAAQQCPDFISVELLETGARTATLELVVT